MSLAFEYIRVTLFAQLAFKFLPVVTSDVLAVLLCVLLSVNPTFETLVMDQADRASTFASENQRISIRILRTPAETAVYLLLFRPTSRQE